jgi:hypothetical protein
MSALAAVPHNKKLDSKILLKEDRARNPVFSDIFNCENHDFPVKPGLFV